MRSIEEICESIGLEPRTLVEVGAAHPRTHRLSEFIARGNKVILIEANPRLYFCLTKGFNEGDFKDSWPQLPPAPYAFEGLEKHSNVEILHAAIVDVPGKTIVFERNASSFVQGIMSPARVNDGYQEDLKDGYEVPGITIGSIDDGNIDVLLADAEGSEWFCIKHLKSRPKVIVLELFGWRYQNPYLKEIMSWMSKNGYMLLERDGSDALFVRHIEASTGAGAPSLNQNQRVSSWHTPQTMKTAIGFLGGQFGDLVVQEPTIRAFLAKNPDYNLILACNKKYFDILKLYEGYSPRLIGFYAYEGYNEVWPTRNDVNFFNEQNVDLIFNAMAQHKDFYWPLQKHQVIECGNMFDLEVTDPQIRLPMPQDVVEKQNYIAMSLFPNDGEGIKSISLAKANAIAAYCRSKELPVVQLNRASEPAIKGAIRINTDFYNAAVQMLGCRLLIVGDTAMSWVASAYDIPTVGLYAIDYYPYCITSKNWNPINKKAIYLEARRAEEIPNEEIFRAIDRQLLTTAPHLEVPTDSQADFHWK